MSRINVGNLSPNTNEDNLKAAFEQYGQIVDCSVKRDETERSLGLGLVTFSSEAEANAAISGLNEQEIDGSRVKVSKANRSKMLRSPGHR